MRFDVMTLFPELVSSVLGESIIGRAQKAGLISVYAHNIRDFANNKHRKVDDTPYGGGFGMLMMAPPVYDCYEFVKKQVEADLGENVKSRVIYMSPQGKILTQEKAQELAEYDNLIILCGHYEGIDSRVLEEIVDEEISIGDYVLTGGEMPACVLIDCVSRLKDGVLADKKCYEDESVLNILNTHARTNFTAKKCPTFLFREITLRLTNGALSNHLKLPRKKDRIF